MKFKKPIVHCPKNPKSAIIWMHGLGASATDFEGIMHLLPIEKHSIKMIFPYAAKIPVTVNGNMVMPAWYNITDFSRVDIDREGISKSNSYIQTLIQEQVNTGIPSNKIIIAGFSQGGAMAIHSGARCDNKLAGILALSCYVLDSETHLAKRNEKNIDTPIWMGHGDLDPVVPYDLGKSSADFLIKNSHEVNFVTYNIQHEVTLEEINMFSKWIDKTLEN